MNLKQHITKLKNLPEVSLDKQAVLLGKHKLLAEINNRQDSRAGYILTWSEAFRFMWLRMLRKVIPAERYVVAFLLLIAVTVSSTYMAQAAVPGDVLWPLKLTYEKAEIAFATDAASEGRIHIRHVDNRLKELTVIAAQPDTEQKSRNISQLVRRLEKDITAADQSLKLTKEEKKDSEPQVIMALAQDLSDKAQQAATILESNQQALDPGSQLISGDVEPLAVIPTSTTTGLPSGTNDAPATITPTTSEPVSPKPDDAQTLNADASSAVAEAQVVNEAVSYSALSSMIDMVERYNIGADRSRVSLLMLSKVNQQKDRAAELQGLVALIGDNFILHRTEAKILLKSSDQALTDAAAFIKLDNLSGAFKKVQDAKDMLFRVESLLDEVRSGNGFIKPKPEPAVIPKPVQPQSGEVKIQSVTGTTTDTDVTD